MKGPIKFVVNLSKQDFTWKYAGQEATVKAGDFLPLPDLACDLFVKHANEFDEFKGKIKKVENKEEAESLLQKASSTANEEPKPEKEAQAEKAPEEDQNEDVAEVVEE